jgi:hypothetical protein
MDWRQASRIFRQCHGFQEPSPKVLFPWHDKNHLEHQLGVSPIEEIEQAIADKCLSTLFKSEGFDLPTVDELVKHGKSQRNMRISQGYDIPEISDAEWAKMILRRLAVFQEALKTWGTLPTSPQEFLERPLSPSSAKYLQELKAKKLNHVV